MKFISVSKLKKYESEFHKNKYNGVKRKKPYKYLKGKTCVLVSACHTVNHSRNGDSKVADMLTGAFAKYLHKETGCHIFYRIYNDGCDPNFDDEFHDGGYKDTLAEVVEENNIKIVLDLHAASEKRKFDIDLGTDFGNCLQGFDFIPQVIKIFAERNGINDITHNAVFSAPPNTVTNYISKNNNIPTIQLEINRKFRNYEDADSINNMLRTISDSIYYFNQFDWANKNVKIFKVERSKIHIPHDKIEFSEEDIVSFGINHNDKFMVHSISAGKSDNLLVHFYKKNTCDDIEIGSVRMTNRLIFNLFGECGVDDKNDYVMICFNKILTTNVGVSKSAHDNIVAGRTLFEKLDSTKKYLLYNRIFKIELLIDKIGLNENTTAPNCLFLDRYQKQLFNINLPIKSIPAKIFEGLLIKSELTKAEKDLFNKAYTLNDGIYEIKKSEFGNKKLVNIQKKVGLAKLEIIETEQNDYQRGVFFKHIGRKLKDKILTRLIGSKTVMLRAGRAYPVDEQSDIVRLSPDIMKVLGVSEMDKVIVENGNKVAQLRVLEASNFDLNKIVNDYVYDEIDGNILIGIPNKWRIYLGIYSINNIVLVKRDISHINRKNTNKQLLPFIGIIFTILETFNDNFTRLILILVLFPTAVYINFSDERSKIK